MPRVAVGGALEMPVEFASPRELHVRPVRKVILVKYLHFQTGFEIQAGWLVLIWS